MPHTSRKSISRDCSLPTRDMKVESRLNSSAVSCISASPTKARCAGVDANGADFFLQDVALAVLAPPQDRAYAEDQLAHAERLGDEIVGAELEADHPIDLFAAAGDHDDRDVPGPRRALELAADLGSGDAGEHQIEQDQIRRAGPGERERLVAAARRKRLVSRLLQVEEHQIGEVLLVLDDEDQGGRGHALVST